MDIHRSRFIPYPSSAINALAFSATNDGELSKGGLKNLRLAVGRANGDIEIWNPLKGAWVQERTFYGGRDRSIEGVLWTQEPSEYEGNTFSSTGQLRLFSIGYSSAVTEWDLGTGLPLRQSSGNLSEIWCFAAQPRLHLNEAKKAAKEGRPCGQDIVVGCADGSVALLSTGDNDLHFQKYIARPHSANARALSISFRDRHTVAVGFTNSSFRIYDIRSSTVVRTVTLGAGSKGGPKNLHVWALRWLPKGDIVTADSAGEVRFFDAKLFTQYQRIKAHEGDILSISTSQDGSYVFTAGIDRRTSIFVKASSGRHWVRAGHKIYHEHDVKSLAVYDGSKTQQMSFLASGGLDTNLSIIPVRQLGQEYHRVVSGLPQQPPVTSSSTARLVASWHGQEVTIWRLKQKRNQASDERVHRLIARIAVKGDEAIASASVSKDGQVLAIITASETRIFRLLPPEDETVEALRIEKVEVETPLPGGRDVQISPNQKWLSIVSNTNDVLVYRLSEAEGSLHISRRGFRVERVKRGSDSSSLQSYRRVITRQQFSADSKILVVTDISGFLDCWSLEGEEDRSAPDVEMQDADDDTSDTSSSSEEDEGNAEFKSYGQYWSSMESSKTLPQLDSAALVLSFRPAAKVKRIQTNGANGTHLNGVVKKSLSGEAGRDEHEEEEDDDVTEQPNNKYELFILSANHRLYELDLSAGRLTDWSRRNATNCLPVTLNKIKDRAMGCYWHTSPEAQRLYLYGSNWLFMLDVLQNFEPETDPDELEKENGLIGRPQKRKWQGESGAGDKIREEDYAGFKPGMQTTQNREPVKKKKKEQQNLVKTEGGEDEDEEEDVLPNKRLQPADSPMNDVRKESDADDDEKEEAGESRHPRKTWHSFAYRPIFAVIPLKETSSYIETVLVERPMWELNLPPRLAGPHDR